MINNPLKYSNCWEDPDVLMEGLQVDSSSRVMSIASGGDNSLMLLTANPESLVCLDLSEVQVSVTRIKETAIRELPYEEFLELMGFQASSRRGQIYSRIQSHLTEKDAALFEAEWMENPLVHAGKFERYFQVFAHRILPWIHRPSRVSELFRAKSEEEQQSFYSKKWNNWRWRLLFRIFFSRYVMGKYGREPEKLKEVTAPVAETIFNRAGEHLASKECQSNYMLRYALTGEFGAVLPPYAKRENFLKIQAWLRTNSIQYHQGDLVSALRAFPNCNRFNLSNIFEYMTMEEFEIQEKALLEYGSEGMRVGYWELLVDRNLATFNRFEEGTITGADCGFFYKGFRVFKR